MSLYRQVGGSRALAATLAGAIGLAVGAIAGLLIASSDGDSSLRAEVVGLQDEVRPALSALELVPIEYRQAVRRGRVVSVTEYEASRAQVGRAREVLAERKDDFAVLGASDAAAADTAVESLARLVTRRASPAEVERAAAAAARAVELAARLGRPRKGA
jgi:hypothetical protein